MSKCENLIERYNALVEGGLPKLPNGLLLKVSKAIRAHYLGLVLGRVDKLRNKLVTFKKVFEDSIQDTTGNKASIYGMLHRIDALITLADSYMSPYTKIAKRVKNTTKLHRLKITKKDMLPYIVDKGFDILLHASKANVQNSVQGMVFQSKGSTSIGIEELTVGVQLGAASRLLDKLTDLTDDKQIKKEGFSSYFGKMKGYFWDLKTFRNTVNHHAEEIQAVVKHELLHVIQSTTKQGYSHKDYKDIGYKNYHTNDWGTYATSPKEYKAWLSSMVDNFFISYPSTVLKHLKDRKKGQDNTEALIKQYVGSTWFKSFKNTKKKNTAIRDFITALKKDRRYKPFKRWEQ